MPDRMKQKHKVFLYTAGVLYVFFMLWLLFGQRLNRWSDGYNPMRMLEKINLIPLHTIREFLFQSDNRTTAIFNLAGNVILFIPLGVLIPAVFPNVSTFRHTMFVAAVTMVCVEILQLVSLLGSLDVDDLLLNLLGAAIGYGVFRFLTRKQ